MKLDNANGLLNITTGLEERYIPRPVPARIEDLRKGRAEEMPERLLREDRVSARVETLGIGRRDENAVKNTRAPEDRDFGLTLEHRLRKMESPESAGPIRKRARVSEADATAETGAAAESMPAIDEVNKAVKAQVQKISNLLKKLGIDAPSETVGTENFVKQVLKIAANFLGEANGAGDLTVKAIIKDALASLKDLSIQINITPEQATGLFEELVNALQSLQGLLALQEKLEKGEAPTAEELALLTAVTESQAIETEKGEIPETEATAIETAPETDETAEAAVQTEAAPVDTTEVAAEGPVQSAPVPVAPVEGETAVAAVEPVESAEAPETSAAPIKEAPAVSQESETPVIKPENSQPVLEAAVAAQTETAQKVVQVKDKPVQTKESETANPGSATAVEEAKKGEPAKVEASANAGASNEKAPNEAAFEFTPTGEETDNPTADTQSADAEIIEIKPENTTLPEKNLFLKTLTELREAAAGPQSTVRTLSAQFEAPVHQARYTSQEHPVSEKAVVQQLTSKFQLFTGQHGSEVRIQLKPEHLGQVKISIEIDRDVVVTRMQVESEKVRHIVENNVQTLKNALEEQGIKVERFEVTVNQGRDDFFRRDAEHTLRRGNGRVRYNHYGVNAAREVADEEPAETGRRYGWNTVEYLG